MKNLYNWIIIIIFAIVLGYSAITTQKYKTLKQEYETLSSQKIAEIDSLEIENRENKEVIKFLESAVVSLNERVDSLDKIKTDIIVNKNNFTISNSITGSANLLKYNLYEKGINSPI